MSQAWEIIEGDCLAILPTLAKDSVIVSDPPYGMDWNTDGSRFRGGHRDRPGGENDGRDDWTPVAGDSVAFDPSPWLDFRKVILWGANHFAQRLPVGTTLVWVKRNDDTFGKFLSDAEVGWMKGGHGVYLHRDLSMNVVNAVKGRRLHPTQKPVGLMMWCIERLRLSPGSLIVDPYCGSGTTGLAAVRMGHRFIGIDLERRHVEAARCRIRDDAPLFNTPTVPRVPDLPGQATFFEDAS